MFVFLLFVLCALAAPPCGKTTVTTFKFDDVTVINAESYTALPRPYNGFVFRRVNTPYVSYPDDHIPVMNVSSSVIPSYFVNGATSPPNLLFTTGESMSIRKSNNRTFAITTLQMKSIYIGQMAIFINTSRLGVVTSSQLLNLPTSAPLLVSINQNGLDEILIGCVNPQFATCAHITFDDISLCRI